MMMLMIAAAIYDISRLSRLRFDYFDASLLLSLFHFRFLHAAFQSALFFAAF